METFKRKFSAAALVIVLASIGLSSKAHAASIAQLDIQGELVIFTTTEAKSHNVPTCVSTDNTEKWAVNLNTQKGVLAYGMLLSAFNAGLQIEVTSTDACEGATAIEGAKSLRIISAQG